MTITIFLFTEDGSLVKEMEIPQFLELPKVLLWGARTFVQELDPRQYREVFAYRVLTQETKSEESREF